MVSTSPTTELAFSAFSQVFFGMEVSQHKMASQADTNQNDYTEEVHEEHVTNGNGHVHHENGANGHLGDQDSSSSPETIDVVDGGDRRKPANQTWEGVKNRFRRRSGKSKKILDVV